MDFDKYVDCLTQIDNDECRARWETFYTLNRGVLSSFVAIDNAIQEVLKSRYISDEAMKQVESVLPSLSRLKIEIEKIQRTPEDLSDKYRAKVESAIYTLQNAMTLSEIPLFENEFIQLLESNYEELERETSRKKEEEMIRKKEEEERRRLEERDDGNDWSDGGTIFVVILVIIAILFIIVGLAIS